MKCILNLFCCDIRRRSKDSFLIGYNLIFPVVMIVLLGYLSSGTYGRQFTGYQYYAIVMLPFCIAMAVITAAYAGKEEAYRKTAVRFLFAPLSGYHIVLAKLLSCTIIISCCNLLILLFSFLVFRLPIAGVIIPVGILLAEETFAVCAIGMLIGLGMKNFIFIKNVLNIPILISAVLAGAFFPFGTFRPGLKLAIKLSPLTWVNRSIFLAIYDGSSVLLWKTAAVLFAAGVLFTVLACILFKKEEFIHGDLPGYEK